MPIYLASSFNDCNPLSSFSHSNAHSSARHNDADNAFQPRQASHCNTKHLYSASQPGANTSHCIPCSTNTNAESRHPGSYINSASSWPRITTSSPSSSTSPVSSAFSEMTSSSSVTSYYIEHESSPDSPPVVKLWPAVKPATVSFNQVCISPTRRQH